MNMFKVLKPELKYVKEGVGRVCNSFHMQLAYILKLPVADLKDVFANGKYCAGYCNCMMDKNQGFYK